MRHGHERARVGLDRGVLPEPAAEEVAQRRTRPQAMHVPQPAQHGPLQEDAHEGGKRIGQPVEEASLVTRAHHGAEPLGRRGEERGVAQDEQGEPVFVRRQDSHVEGELIDDEDVGLRARHHLIELSQVGRGVLGDMAEEVVDAPRPRLALELDGDDVLRVVLFLREELALLQAQAAARLAVALADVDEHRVALALELLREHGQGLEVSPAPPIEEGEAELSTWGPHHLLLRPGAARAAAGAQVVAVEEIEEGGEGHEHHRKGGQSSRQHHENDGIS